MTLDQYGRFFGTDKSSLLHGYLEQYEKHLPARGDVKDFLEIGLQRGGRWRNEHTSPSLAMWGEFYPSAKLYGFDIKDLEFNDERITFQQGDQGSAEDLALLAAREYDVILDDGSHIAEHQIGTFLALRDCVRAGGVYIIEDCNPVVQKDLPADKRIHALIAPYLIGVEHVWIASKTAGQKSSLIIKM